jgi:hypothetical protein
MQGKAEPYNGPAGTMGECGIPQGPMAYNIGTSNGSGVRCNAKTVFVGFKGSIGSLPAGVMGGGYINPLTEKGNRLPGTIPSLMTGAYGEYKFLNYAPNSPGGEYVKQQVLHWKGEAAKRGQKCIPVDIDNCDSVKIDNYMKILDTVESLNNAGPKVMVMVKNPLDCGNGRAFKHKVAVGAFQEEISVAGAKQLASLRANINQVILFASGSGPKSPNHKGNINTKAIQSANIPNTAYSYDSGKEYSTIYNCTYIPGGNQATPVPTS